MDTSLLRADFYVTGGTLRPDAPSYVERQADKDLCRGLLNGEFCYVLTSRQMGKSSLMVRTVKRLREDGVAVAVLDLTAIGQNLTIDQWYDGLISRLGQQLDLEDELFEFWNAHPELGPLQRWLMSIEQVVLPRIPSRIVIFVDEIDIVRSLQFSTDEFFAAIREAYNRRSQESAFDRLAFGLLGVASPTDLIRDPRTTPFNIGRRIELNDFTAEEAAPLARGLGPDDPTARVLLGRILYWTGGHPYLTQRLCRALADSVLGSEDAAAGALPPRIPTLQTVDRLAESLFLSKQARDRDDNLIFVRERMLRSELDVAGMLYLYRRILNRERVPDDDTDPLVSELRLAGIVRGRQGYLQVRNRIYGHVFEQQWIQSNMPEAELRRQRSARRKGVVTGLALAVVLILTYLFVWPRYADYRRARMAQNTLHSVQATYSRALAYRDTFESTLDVALGAVAVPVRGSGTIQYEAPNKISLSLRSDYSTPETDLRITADGRVRWVQVPGAKEFRTMPVVETNSLLWLPVPLAEHVGPMRLFPVYRLLLEPQGLQRFLSDASGVRFSEDAELDGRRVVVLEWNHAAVELLRSAGFTNPVSEKATIPIKAWISRDDNQILQMRLDLSRWAKPLTAEAEGLQITGLVLTESHRNIETNLPASKQLRFRFTPAAGWTHVFRFSEPPQRISTLSSLKRQFAQMIPPRFPEAPDNLIDLTDFYNAPLSQAWHPGLPANSLDALPPGVLQFGAVYFDVRGIVQLSGKRLENAGGHYPRSIWGIPIEQYCSNLHFLHACGWRVNDDTRVGSYLVHYEDGSDQVIPIIYGEDVRDWSQQSDPSRNLRHANLVWNVINGAGAHVRLFKTTWVNPFPDLQITSLDFLSAMSDAAPFLIAVTAEP
jgi:hypothetical protein